MESIYKLLFIFLISLSAFAKLSFVWTGVTGVLLKDDKTSIYFDPYFSRPSLWKIAMGSEYKVDRKLVKDSLDKIEVKKLDGIFISHSHFDHALDMHVVQQLVGGKIYGSNTTLTLARAHGVSANNLVETKLNRKYKVGAFEIEVLKGQHAKLLDIYKFKEGKIKANLARTPSLSDYVQGEVFVYLISHPEGDFLFHASAKPDPGLAAKIKDRDFKAAFLGIANREDTNTIYKDIIEQAKSIDHVVPIHHDNFLADRNLRELNTLPGVGFDEFLKFSEIKKQTVINPKYNEKVEF